MEQFKDKIKFSLNVKIKDGKKQFIGMPKKWNDLNKSTIKKTHKDIAILTGEKNNITIIDFDKEEGMKYYKQFENIIKDTFIETSFSGYKHAYFEYDEDLKTEINLNNINIDILNNGKCCVMGKENNNNKITKIPKEFKEFLIYHSSGAETNSETDLDTDSDISFDNESSKTNINDNEREDISSINKIRDLVKLIDCKYSDNRNDWIKIGMCIKQIINDNDEAFDIWNDFSKLSKKYNLKNNKKEWDTFKKIESFSIGTLFHYAKENKKGLKNWNKQYREEEKEININNIPLLNKFDLKNEYCFCTLKDYLFNNKFKNINLVIEYLELNLHKVCVRVDDYMITKKPIDNFNNIHNIEPFNKNWRVECLVKYWKYNEKTDCEILQKISLKDFLEDYPHLINSFYKVNSEFIIKDQILNKNEFYITEQFQAKYIENLNEDDINKIQPLLDMIMIVYCNNDKELYNLIMMLFSFWVCNPNDKSGKCLILTGKQGCGKSTIIEFFMDFIFGNKICMMLKGFKELLSDKNGHLSGKKFVNLNETKSKKGDYFTNFDDLKTLISDKIISIRGMFKETKNEKSSMELIVTTNNPNCCPIEDNDRKYIVLKVNEIYMQKDNEYWSPFRKQIFNQECANIFYSYLLNMETTMDKWRAIDFKSLNTELKNDLNKLNKNSVELFISDLKEQIMDILDNEEQKKFLIHDEYITYKNIANEDMTFEIKYFKTEIRFQPSSLYNGYISYCKNNGEHPLSMKYFRFDLKNKFNIERSLSSITKRWFIFNI